MRWLCSLVALLSMLACGRSAGAQQSAAGSLGWHELPNTALLTAKDNGKPVCAPGDATTHGVLGCSAVIRAWSSAVADTKRNRLILWGGGHNDYYGNEFYALELGANPPRLVRLNEPTLPGNAVYGCKCVTPVTGACNLSEIPPPPSQSPKAPNSRHTYNQIEYIPDADEVFAFGGFTAGCIGVAREDAWLADLGKLDKDRGANPWERIDGNLRYQGAHPGKVSGSSFGGNLAYDAARKAVWYSDQAGLFLFDLRTGSVSERGEVNVGSYAAAALNSADESLLFVTWDGQQSANRFVVASTNLKGSIRGSDITKRMSGCDTLTSSGRLNNIGLVFDPIWKVFVAWPNFGSSVFLINPSSNPAQLEPAPAWQKQAPPFTCTEVTSAMLDSTKGPPDSSHAGAKHTSNGTFGRFRYFPALDEFALCSDADASCYVLRLRGEAKQNPAQ
jgi:hypothetical protein